MLAALQQASAFDFVAGLKKDRLETVVGDRGTMVSQGERQRLALARAFLRRPSMLILDEATNSLDSENEGRVLDAMEGRARLELTISADRASPFDHPTGRSDLRRRRRQGGRVGRLVFLEHEARRPLPRALGSAEF